jgi:acetyl esterase/lipase
MGDARSAIRWMRMNAEALGIDPEKIVAAGGSAGAQIALAAAMLDGFDDEGDDASISCQPNALLLYNPILDTTRKGVELEKFTDKKQAKAASPLHHCRKGLPPMMIFHGTADRVVPYETSRKFVRKLRWRGNDCRLTTYEGCGHGFFNFNVDAGLYELTLNAADAFLVERGFLAKPEHDTEPRLANY